MGINDWGATEKTWVLDFRLYQKKPMSTSGSTGTPFTILQDKNKRNRVEAEIIYFGDLCGYHLGDRNTYLRVWTEKNKKSFLGALKQNLVMIDIAKLDDENLEK